MPFAVVAVVLIWQWGIALGLPSLEKRLIYSGEDDSQLARLQDLSERLLTRNDLQQLLEVILRAMCDYLQVKSAFAIAFQEEGPELVAAIGPSQPDATWLRTEAENLRQTEAENLRQASTTSNDQRPILREWHSYWITPQTSQRLVSEHGEPLPIGIIGIQARSTSPDLNEDEMKAFIDLSHRPSLTSAIAPPKPWMTCSFRMSYMLRWKGCCRRLALRVPELPKSSTNRGAHAACPRLKWTHLTASNL